MVKFEFCQNYVYLKDGPMSFADRPYLQAIYASRRNIVLRCSRQSEKSTFLVNSILYEAIQHPGIQILFVCPREEQVQMFSRVRLLASLEQSPLLRRRLLGPRGRRPQVMNVEFRNRSRVFLRAAYLSADACRGISADLLLVDEFQDVAAGNLPVLQETLSHARCPRTILTGTPKMLDNHLEAVFRQSTANEWTITCPQCSHAAILDERALGPHGLICSDCQGTIDARQGQWVPRNPDAKWGDGFWINHAMVPWLNYDDLLERQRTYDLARFKNEVLGLPTTLGDHIVTREELEACCDSQPMTQSLAQIPPAARSQLVAGIDWGGGGASRTVLVIGYMDPKFCFHVSRFERFAPSAIKEDPIQVSNAVAERCRQFQVRWIAADGGGNGHVFNRLLLDKLKRHEGLHAILYGVVDQEPFRDGVLIKWTVNRSASIGVLFSRIKNHQMAFPRTPDCGGYLDEFACEIAEYDSINRTIKFSHPESQPDDALHATNYALLVAIKAFHAARSW